jgi:hypothetical protein
MYENIGDFITTSQEILETIWYATSRTMKKDGCADCGLQTATDEIGEEHCEKDNIKISNKYKKKGGGFVLFLTN